MGYSLTIGQPHVGVDVEDEFIYIYIDSVRHDGAPAFGEPTDFTNERWPSYSGWSNFLSDVGQDVYSMFSNASDGIMRNHPGCAPITKEHRDLIKSKILERKEIGEVAGFEEGQSHTLARLEWLDYWFSWALENCATPAMRNS